MKPTKPDQRTQSDASVLVTGRGTSGSWAIRGQQLGTAIGATVTPRVENAKGFSKVIIVKRHEKAILRSAKRSGVPLVWDVVDAWPQPIGNVWGRTECMQWLRESIRAIEPTAIVAATPKMMTDIRELGFRGPVISVPHHAWPGKPLNPVRQDIKRVGYQGGAQHLGDWQKWLNVECARRGWEFVINPGSLSEVDVVVALRHDTGYAPMNWKSNVKLANAQGSGTPIICARECGYVSTAGGAELWADTREEVSERFGYLTGHFIRSELAQRLYESKINLHDVAAEYKRWLSSF